MSDDHQNAGHHHGDGHGHGAGHHHSHDHASIARGALGRAFGIGIALNLVFVLAEAAFGFLANSMALLADAGHNLSDVFGLLVAWGAIVLGRSAPTPRYTYGLRSTSIYAALANAMFLLLAVGAIVWEALHRLAEPQPVAGKTVIVVAAIGIAINGATAWMFRAGRKEDINVHGAYLHMVADALVSLGVVAGGLVILATGWLWVDPLVSLIVAAVIVWGTWGLLRDSLTMALQAVPPGIDPAAVRRTLESAEGVSSIHDLHIWSMSTTETALTCHLVMRGGAPEDAFLAGIAKNLQQRFGIAHVTLQVERGEGSCTLEPDHVV